MKTYFFCEKFFPNNILHTEDMTYQLLIKDPLVSQVNYIAVPWVWLIHHHKLHLVPSVTFDGGFTVCQHIKFEKIIPILKSMGVDVLFTPHVLRTKIYDGITVLPYPHFQTNTAKPAQKKDLLYSFIGIEWSHSVRRKMFSMKHPENTYIVKRAKWNSGDTEEYKDVLSRSRFALCPRGTGASTIRFWEALGAGAIPILISDEMTLPEGFDWSTAIVQVSECDIAKIPKIISNITPEDEHSMRVACLQIHEMFSGDNFVSVIRQYYDQ